MVLLWKTVVRDVKNQICMNCHQLKMWCECNMKRRTLKNKVYKLPVTDIKPLKVDTSEYEKLKPIKEIKYVKRKFRENVPPLELAWLKTKAYFRNVGVRFEARFSMAISEFVKQLAKSVTVYAVVFLIIVVLILTMKYLL